MTMGSVPAEQNDLNLFAGATTGLLKGVSVNSKGIIAKNFSNMAGLGKKDEITALEWDAENSSHLLVGSRSGIVKTFDTSEKKFTASFNVGVGASEDPLVGVARHSGCLAAATESGIVKFWKSDNVFEIDAVEHPLRNAPGSKLIKDNFESEEAKGKHLAILKAGRNLSRFLQSPFSSGKVATAGKETELALWNLDDLENGPVFQAKNVKADKLQLRVPVWVSDLAFMSDTTLSTVSKHGHVRLYDVRSGRRRPVAEHVWTGESPTATTCVTEHQLVVGCGTGMLALFDFRKIGKKDTGMVRKYKGCVGSVRRVSGNRGSDYFATVGLDRYLRVYEVNDQIPTQRLYVKSKLNNVVISKDFDPTRKPPGGEETKDEAEPKVDGVIVVDPARDETNMESDEIFWTKLKVVRDKFKRRKADVNEKAAKKKRV